jgi:hypothetical protein
VNSDKSEGGFFAGFLIPLGDLKMSRKKKSKQPDYNNMSFHDFDQSEDGVRKLAKAGKFKAAGEAIERYISANNEKLTPGQRCLLWFHAGQGAAMSNRNAEALTFFEKASETIPDDLNPNNTKYALADFVGPATGPYLKATIAFIKNQDNPDIENTKVMYEALNEINQIPIEDYPHTNVVLIPGRVNDMCATPHGKTYAEIWQMEPSLPPLPGKTSWHRIHIPKDHPEYEGELVGDYRSKLEDTLNELNLVESDFGMQSDTAKRCLQVQNSMKQEINSLKRILEEKITNTEDEKEEQSTDNSDNLDEADPDVNEFFRPKR